mmetsp:Transcript_107532/g.302682  ORF Transcript_107532/g.302682 Transcript_107532/m.302682 type:complete len:222 (+) Transcript_107532:1792-2457(+)
MVSSTPTSSTQFSLNSSASSSNASASSSTFTLARQGKSIDASAAVGRRAGGLGRAVGSVGGGTFGVAASVAEGAGGGAGIHFDRGGVPPLPFDVVERVAISGLGSNARGSPRLSDGARLGGGAGTASRGSPACTWLEDTALGRPPVVAGDVKAREGARGRGSAGAPAPNGVGGSLRTGDRGMALRTGDRGTAVRTDGRGPGDEDGRMDMEGRSIAVLAHRP